MEIASTTRTISGRISRHHLYDGHVAYFNKDNQCLAVQNGHMSGLSSVASYWYTEGFRAGAETMTDAPDGESMANKFFFAPQDYVQHSEPSIKLEPFHDVMPLYEVCCVDFILI